MIAEISLHLTDWAESMAHDCTAAERAICVSAFTMLPPRTPAPGPWPALWFALVAAASRGVHVRVYLPAPTHINPATLQNLNTARLCQSKGITCHLIPGVNLLHCKSLIVDDDLVWIGSGNFTHVAASMNYEAYTRTRSREFADAMLNRWKDLR